MIESAFGERWASAVEKRPWLATVETLFRRFRADRLALVAGSLTFTTIISLVPLITVMLALLSAFPMFAAMQESLQRYFLQALVPDAIARPVMGAITQFSLRASRLGTVGLLALGVSALAMMLTIDRALNAIWHVKRRRRITQRILVYWAAVTLGPLIFAVSLTATSYAVSASRGLVGDMPRGFGFAVGSLEFMLEGLGVAALFRFVPNTHVHWRHALLGGAFVAICMFVAKRALTAYFGAVPTYSLIYGAFATLPIFLVWIYLAWVIVLLGAVIAAYAPLVGRRVAQWPQAPGSDFRLALVVLGRLAAARLDGRRGASADDIAGAVGIDPLQLEPIFAALIDLDWVGRLEEAHGGRYVLLCDPQTTPAGPLLARLLLDRAPDLEPTWKRAGFDALRLGELLPTPVGRA